MKGHAGPPPRLPCAATVVVEPSHPRLSSWTLTQFVLRTINTSRSAYMSLTFGMRFFDTYDVYNCEVVQAGLLLKVGTAVWHPLSLCLPGFWHMCVT